VVDRFTQTRVGAFLQQRFAERFTKPTQTVFLLLALGFLLSSVRHTVANYLWRSGACLVQHYTRFYAFLGGPFLAEMDGLWRAVIRQAASRVPKGEPVRLRVDETVCKKSGEKIEPADTYRNGAGTARQEYRTLWGICFVLGEMQVRLSGWSEEPISVPIGLKVYLKEEKAEELGKRALSVGAAPYKAGCRGGRPRPTDTLGSGRQLRDAVLPARPSGEGRRGGPDAQKCCALRAARPASRQWSRTGSRCGIFPVLAASFEEIPGRARNDSSAISGIFRRDSAKAQTVR